MKALTVCQPYAELLVRVASPGRSEKQIENRTWPTKYRGTLVIHAGVSRDWMQDGDEERYPGLVFGAIVGMVELYDCVEVERLPTHLRENEHANGPWCWLVQFPRRVRPVPYRGKQGLWELPSDVFFNLSGS